jgi:ABC-type amino acid transport substrate-binding protein
MIARASGVWGDRMKPRKFRLWIIGVGAVLLLLAGVMVSRLVWGGGDDGALERVQTSGELRVGLDASFPPFESLDEAGQVIGFDADLARAIAASLEAEPVFVNVGFDGLYDALLAGRVDVIISGLPYDPRRTRDVIYSQPYFNAGQVLIVRADEAFGDPDQSLIGRMVAVEWGSAADMQARRLAQTTSGLQTLPQPTAQDALKALVAEQADVAIADAVSAYQFMGENAGAVRIVKSLSDEPYVMASRSQSRRLAQAIDDALEVLRRSGALDELRAKWF